MLFDSLAIVGVGLIGGSVGLAAKARAATRHVIGIGRNAETLAKAKSLSAIDEFTTDLPAGVRSADIVVFCSPVDLIARQARAAAPLARPGALFTDAGSTKANIVRDLDATLPMSVRFVGAHPLAGSEKQGAEFARADLFEGRVCVITPTSRTDIAAVERVSLFWSALGCDVKRLSPEEHDLALATTSHVPHFMAALLADSLPERWRAFAATGFRDTTRIAAGDPALWTAIARENVLALAHALDSISGELNKLRVALLAEDFDFVTKLLADAKKVREMLWEVEIRPLGRDAERERVCAEFDLLTQSSRGADLLNASARGFLLEGYLDRDAAQRLTTELLVDPVVEAATLSEIGKANGTQTITVLLKPGVMDPVAESVLLAAQDLGQPLEAVRTFRRYVGTPELSPTDRDLLFRKVLANDAIEQVIAGALHADHLSLGKPYTFRKTTVPLLALNDDGLVKLSRDGQLALNIDEMRTVQAHFREQQRDPTDVELESIAQTWSEHCSHKTLKGPIDFTEQIGGKPRTRRINNLLKETIFGATQELRKRFGADDWCVSVFADNAGVVKFDEQFHACFKVETHNHPSAIEPYGGANTGIGGVIRDPLGTGLGAKPICNTDVFCFAPPDYPPDQLPPGVLHPRRTMIGVVTGVKDYGNRMGIPTVNGAVIFDERYLANPLVFCGTAGLIPVDRMEKAARAGDWIVAVGGRTGRDGIHGATFSSLELTEESESISGGAVQIGNAITEKKVLDIVLQARDRGLYSAITDCGAGGFSSAVGEMGAELGAHVELDKAPLKYAGLSYTEIWISESQERMVLAVPPAKWSELYELCRGEGVEAAIIGKFEATGRLRLSFKGEPVGDLSMHFLHDGRPSVVRAAEWLPPARSEAVASATTSVPPATALLKILSSYSVASKEWVIRQYDHEVQGGSVIKPLTGVANDGPSDAAVVNPVLGSWRGLAFANGVNPLYGDLDPYWMAANAIDEALRNAVAVGADPKRTAILDNFCWGNVNDPAVLGSLVRAAEACRDVALAFGTPFISGKDSLYNAYTSEGRKISIPGTLLISALGLVHDVRQCVTMDLKEPGNDLYVVGVTKDELGGSHYNVATSRSGGSVPRVDLELAPRIFTAIHSAITQGLVRACHDPSEGGLAVAIAEMAFAGGVGADLTSFKDVAAGIDDTTRLFSESASRFILEVKPEHADALRAAVAGLPIAKIGVTVKEQRLRIAGENGEWLIWSKLDELKEAWQKPLRW